MESKEEDVIDRVTDETHPLHHDPSHRKANSQWQPNQGAAPVMQRLDE